MNEYYSDSISNGAIITDGGAIIGRKAQGTLAAMREKCVDEGTGVLRHVYFPWPLLNIAMGNGLGHGEISIVYGSTGASKSWFVLNLLLAAGDAGHSWVLQPLEDTAQRAIERAVAIKEKSWRFVGKADPAAGEAGREELWKYKERTTALYADFVNKLEAENICENPWAPIQTIAGREIRPFDYRGILDFIAANTDKDLIAIDNLTQIPFDTTGRAEYQKQTDFMREALGIVAGTTCHLLLVAHPVKGYRQMQIDDADSMAGSGAFAKLAHNVIAITRHAPPTDDELHSDYKKTVSHNLTITLSKVRDGITGTRLAFDLKADGPVFVEHGVIKLSNKRR